jgi:hypothetical protein
VDHLHDIHDYAWQHLKLASDRMKTQYDKLTNSASFHEGDGVALLFNPHEREVGQASFSMGRPIKNNHPN